MEFPVEREPTGNIEQPYAETPRRGQITVLEQQA